MHSRQQPAPPSHVMCTSSFFGPGRLTIDNSAFVAQDVALPAGWVLENACQAFESSHNQYALCCACVNPAFSCNHGLSATVESGILYKGTI